MCLVTYLPTADGYILSSNRDEEPARAETTMVEETIGTHQLTYPRDIKGGSWIFADKALHNIVLLNGAFELHKRQLPYRMSRGLVIKAYYTYERTADFLEQFDFMGIEPFTLIINEPATFIEFRWDGMTKHIKTLDRTQPIVWSSATLYNADMRKQRQAQFERLLDGAELGLPLAQTIHSYRGDTLPYAYDFNMARHQRVETISRTHIVVANGECNIYYANLIHPST